MASTSYDWIERDTPEAYDLLIDLLDPEFDPKGIAQRLKTQLTDDAKGVLVEHGYVDKDYRSTFYNFYAKKGRQYRPDCVRLHFFDSAVSYDEARSDLAALDRRPEDHYFGYIVLRPTIAATLGRSLFSPGIRLGARGRAILVLSGHPVGRARKPYSGHYSRDLPAFSPFTTSTCLVIGSRYGGSPRWLSILT